MKAQIIEAANKFNFMGRVRELQNQLHKLKESLQSIKMKSPKPPQQ